MIRNLEKAIEEESEPPWYEKMEIAVGATGIIQGSSGLDEEIYPEGDVTDGTVSFDIEILIPVEENGGFYTLLEAGAGEGIDIEINHI
jgi:hypothetical protein